MPAGLQLYDAAGNLLFDVGDSLVQFIGIANVTANGSVTDPRLANGLPVWIYLSDSLEAVRDFYQNPDISISGNTISWTVYGTETGKLIYGTG